MQVKVKHINNLHFKASVRDFEDINLDEPKSFHGTNLGPSPVEYLLIGIGGCLGSSFTYCLIKHNIKIDYLEVIIDGKVSHKLPNMRLKLMQVDVTINYRLSGKIRDDVIGLCLEKFKEHCVVSDSLINGIPINIKCLKI